MVLLIDIGNSTTTIGLYDKGFKKVVRIRTHPHGREAEEYALILRGIVSGLADTGLSGAVISSVVPEETPLLLTVIRKSFRISPLVVSHRIKTGIRFRVKHPARIGADRIANAVGAKGLYRGNLIVLDFGTATTVCLLSTTGEYRSGPIMPGLGLSADTLYRKTAQLPKVDLGGSPVPVVGVDTEKNILSGLIRGHAGGIERIMRDIQAETGAKAAVIATGGYADYVAPFIKRIKTVNPVLTLEGLRMLYALNR